MVKQSSETGGRSWLRWLREVGSHDFCPGANRYVYWLKQPIGWFVVAAGGALMVGLFLGPQGYVLLAAILSVIALGVAWPWLSMLGLSCELRFDRRHAVEGQRIRTYLIVTNRWFVPAWGLMVSRGMRREEVERPAFLSLGLVMPWSCAEFEWEFGAEERGIFPLATPLISTGFPFGIWECNRPVEVRKSLIVWPRQVVIDRWPLLTGKTRSVQGATTPQGGMDGDTLGVRPYRHGDSYRDVHWPQTARQGELIVRERHAMTRREARIIVDTCREHHDGRGSQHSFEWALRLATSLVRELHRQLYSVECCCGPDVATLPAQAPCLSPILDQFAAAHMATTEHRAPPWSSLGNSDAGRLQSDSQRTEGPDASNHRRAPLTFVVTTNRNRRVSDLGAGRSGVQLVIVDVDACVQRSTDDTLEPLPAWLQSVPLVISSKG
ncbi:MAG TPA: DUF58 domain-containing protein, partial [Pirellulaceae bacterium]|nr:DUF58 domain-containing protein [Pirellulaceae bacterium]